MKVKTLTYALVDGVSSNSYPNPFGGIHKASRKCLLT